MPPSLWLMVLIALHVFLSTAWLVRELAPWASGTNILMPDITNICYHRDLINGKNFTVPWHAVDITDQN